jgi:hypothetical protein
MENKVQSLKKIARFAGFLYLIWIITGLYAMFYIPAKINMGGDAVTTSQNILSNEFLFRTGIINDIISSIIWVVMVLIFYRMFKQVNERQAKLLLAFVIVQIPAVFIMEAFNITALMIFKGEVLKSFELSQRQDLAMLFLKISDYGVLILETFWGLWLFPLGILVYKSCFLPRFLGVWLIITSIFYLVLSFTSIMLPQYNDTITNSSIALPIMLGEVALMLWLLIMGAKINIPTIGKQ